MPRHIAFLQRCFEADLFLVSGRQKPRAGGIIVARGVAEGGGTREEIESIMQLDPFVAEGLADVEIVEFRASQVHPLLATIAAR